MGRTLIIVVFFFFSYTPIFGQTIIGRDTSFLKTSILYTKNLYEKSVEGQTHLYNGSEYKAYKPLEDEHPYFKSDEWENGFIQYDQEFFQNVPILYDLEKGKVVIEHYFNGSKIELIEKKIQRFDIWHHTFVWLEIDSHSISNIQSGFYDLLYNGNVKVFVKRSKKINEKLDPSGLTVWFDEKNQSYIFLNGTYHAVKSKSSILKVLSDRKKELKQYISRNHISFYADSERALVQLVQFYDGPHN